MIIGFEKLFWLISTNKTAYRFSLNSDAKVPLEQHIFEMLFSDSFKTSHHIYEYERWLCLLPVLDRQTTK